ncbi:MAG: preprotein translocase subunit SecA, partial [Candidatus Eisenbacteria bacterium]|nr:preprotein translocase subunit SecA [Candidatus Eisenbacteria bacterium]
MLEALMKTVFGSKHDREVKRVRPIVDEINQHVEAFKALSDEALRAKTGEFRGRIAAAIEGVEDPTERRKAERAALDDLLPEAFAAVKEACRRLCGQNWDVVGIPIQWEIVPYDEQLIGATMLHEGRIAEMATGEGKTLVATMPLYLNALTGRGAHLVTVNDYLARRDSEWMGQIYTWLGLTVGCIQSQMDPTTRRAQYSCDITYGTNNEFGFDYLRDNMAVRPDHRVQRGFVYAIVDEVDSVLIDEARTPLIISGPVEHSDQAFDELKPLVDRLVKAQHQLVAQWMTEAEAMLDDKSKAAELGVQLLRIQRAAPKHKRYLKLISERPEFKRMVVSTELGVIRDKRMSEIDDLLYYAIDERARNIDLQDIGREYLSPNDAERFVVPDLAGQLSELEGREDLDANARIAEREQIYRAYASKNEKIHNILALLKAYTLFDRDVEYVVQDDKILIVDEFTGRLMPGRRYSDGLHQAIEAKEGVRIEGETQTLATITLQNFFRMYEKLGGMTGTAETESHEFWEIYKLDVAMIPTHRKVMRADHDDVVFRTKREKFNAVVEEIAQCHERGQPVLVGTISVEVSELLSRMLKRRGVKHSVLNAKYHQQEAEIVSQAGQKGAVTIATNMAGRGTDIKLGAGIPDVGGLRIIGTERHESRRIDRQLRGRAGRQGDPGESRFYLSLEDDLMRLFGSERISGLMQRMGVQEGEVIEHPIVTASIGRAQKRVEAHNFDIRKHLLEYDNVMNQQRTVVYDLRNKALLANDISENVLDAVEESVRDRVSKATGGAQAHAGDWNLRGLADELSYLLTRPVAIERLETATSYEALEDTAVEIGVEAYRAREQELGMLVPEGPPGAEVPEPFPALRWVERQLYLMAIDQHWRDHLYELDHLKGGIGLRAYGQKDPLLEYKKEAFNLFETLVQETNDDFVKQLFRV